LAVRVAVERAARVLGDRPLAQVLLADQQERAESAGPASRQRRLQDHSPAPSRWRGGYWKWE
jgi:hypothetical protein